MPHAVMDNLLILRSVCSVKFSGSGMIARDSDSLSVAKSDELRFVRRDG